MFGRIPIMSRGSSFRGTSRSNFKELIKEPNMNHNHENPQQQLFTIDHQTGSFRNPSLGFHGQEFHRVFQIDQGNQESFFHPDRLLEESGNTQSTNVLGNAVQGREIVKEEICRADSISDCSFRDQDGDDQKSITENEGRKPQAKNLLAERRRRKKLNDRILSLRSIVPKISKMNKAATLGDAIVYVKELQKEVKMLQDELETTPDDVQQNFTTEMNQFDAERQRESGESSSGLRMANEGVGLSPSAKIADQKTDKGCGMAVDQGQKQMEAQVEVIQFGGNEFSLKVLCENKEACLSGLMEAINSLGLDVIMVNMITFRGIALIHFQAEMMDNKLIQADQVRESLLEVMETRMCGFN